jgi:hypothetical protein
MVSEPHLVAYYNPTSILKGVCFRYGSKNGHQTNMFLIKNGLRIPYLLIILGSVVDIIMERGTYMTFI